MAVVDFLLGFMILLGMESWLGLQDQEDFPPVEWVLSPIRLLLVTAKCEYLYCTFTDILPLLWFIGVTNG